MLSQKGAKIRAVVVVAGVLLLISYAAIRKNPAVPEKSAAGPYNLIFISIDTVRTDALNLYNPAGAPTPGLNRIAEKSHVFTNAISQVPFTLPSHCTMLTGSYPMAHGVQENLTARLSNSAITLAEVLKENGYTTAGFAASVVMAAHTGIDQGFDLYDDSFGHHNVKREDAGGVQKTADEVHKSFHRWFEKKKHGKFFAFIHFYDPHLPYDPPPAFTPANRTESELYKGELQYVDSVIGKLFDAFASKNILENTVLIITGDHGEMLGEHNENGHGYFIYQEVVKVPLLIALPGQTERRTIENTVQLVDLMPTVLDILSIPVPKEVQGQSLGSLMEGTISSDRIAYSESLTPLRYFGTPRLSSIQDRKYKYVHSPRPELFDLQADPHESNNLVIQHASIAAAMKKKLDEIVKNNTISSANSESERTLSPEESEKLASLGYIDSGRNASSSDTSRDPKDYIQSWNDLNKLSGLLQNHKYRESLSILDRLKPVAAFNSELRTFEARSYSGLGDHTKAIQILEKVIADDPENTQALMTFAYSLRKTGQTEKAASIYDKLLERDTSILAMQNYARLLIHLNKKEELRTKLNQMKAAGKFTERHDEMLGEIYFSLNDFAQAREHLERAIDANPDSPMAYINFSVLLDSQGKTSEAITLLETNRGRFNSPDYELQLGRVYHNAGNRKKEFEVFQKMVETYKQDPRGYFYLAQFLLQQQSDPRSVIQLAERGISLNRDPEFEPFGYFLLSDAYTVLGMKKEAEFYLKRAKQLEAK